jgi:uncharacterized protein (TIGR02466 family)
MSVPKLIDVTPFEPNIIKVHYDGFDWDSLRPICNKIINGIDKNAPIEIGDAKSSIYSKNAPHLNKEFQNFYNWLNPIVKHVVYNEWSYNSSFKYDIGMSWVNMHGKGGVTLEHNHGTVVIVAATYLQLEPGMGYIEFKDPLEYVKGFMPRWEKNVTEWKTIPAKTGDTFLFPGWLRHKTQENTLDKERLVLTTNFNKI